MPDTRELPRMLRAVVPLMRTGDAVVGELIADRLPGLPAVVRTLHDLAVPAGGLGRVQPVRIGRRGVEMVHLPAREQRALHVPIATRPVRRQDESAFPGAHEKPHSAHRFPPCRSRTTILSNDEQRPWDSTASGVRPPGSAEIIGGTPLPAPGGAGRGWSKGASWSGCSQRRRSHYWR